MNVAILKLQEHLVELQEKLPTLTVVGEKAVLIGVINEIDTAIKLIRKCDALGIVPGSLVKQLPDTSSSEFQFVVAHMNESTNPSAWEEVLFEGQQFWLDAGDLLIKR